MNMTEILISLALLKLRSRFSCVDPFLKQCLILSYGLYPYLMMILWPVHFDDYLCYVDVILSSVNVKLLISDFCSLSQVICCSFLIMTRKVEIPKSCPTRDRIGRQAIGVVTVGIKALCSEKDYGVKGMRT